MDSSYKDASGQWVEKPSFFDVVVWGPRARTARKYLTKGRQVAVDGRLDQRSWEAQDGTKRSKVEIIADTVDLPRRAAEVAVAAAKTRTGAAIASGVGSKPPDRRTSKTSTSADEDDIPF